VRRFLHRIIRFFFVLLAAGALWIGWYAGSHGFSRKWRELVTKEFHKRGVEIYMHRLTLDPLRGLVAREVFISNPRTPRKRLAVIDRIALDINYSNLFSRRTVSRRGGFARGGPDAATRSRRPGKRKRGDFEAERAAAFPAARNLS
jgi:hypothetical protein